MIMQDIKISIVIPIYNVAPYVEECIQSVMNQTWKGKLECILVDDCGTDDSMKVATEKLKGYNGKIDFKVICHERNRGLSAARNSGIDAVTGDYVYFLDSDDEITPDCIDLLVQPLDGAILYDVIVGDYQITGSDMPKPSLLLKDGCSLLGESVLHSYRKGEWYMLSVNKLYRVDFLKSNHLYFYEGIIHEDELWSFQIACLAKSLYVRGCETYLYKVRAGSITVCRDHQRRCESIKVILKEMREFSFAHQLQGNKDVYNLIRNFQMIMLFSLNVESPVLFPQFYTELRQMEESTWKECFLMDGCDLRKQLRDLHLSLPIAIAIPYLKLLFYFL